MSSLPRKQGPPASALDPTAALPRGAASGLAPPLRWLAWILTAAALSVVITTPLDVYTQALFGGGVFLAALALSRVGGRYLTLVLMLVSVTVSSRYIFWRVSTTLGSESGVDATLSMVLLVAELYAFLVLLMGYVQTAWPLRRRPVALPADTTLWPTVDIFIPTYNEPLNVVRATILAAKAVDWPADKLAIYVLDDGKRDAFRAFCAQAGVGYLTRPDNRHAKAGNINHALKHTRGDYVAIFDCDHVPTRSFLQLTMGWLVRDDRMAMVQTPHHFYSPDPFERNLGTFRRVPNEGELFYGVIQRGNDLHDATFFCGSCAVIKRGPLEEVGGIAPETVTEDAHTMLKLHRRGYRSAYIDLPLAAGLATESLSAHVGQRIRWARGMAQIFRIDNPLLRRGLRFFQRLCYAAAMLHFFYGIPRIIFLTAPLAYLFFDAHIFNASAPLILAYALPHLAHSVLTNSRVQGRYRHSFWAEVYESVLAYYITIPTTLAIISPKLGKFNVTAKGGVIEDTYFDRKIATPYIALLLLNLAGVGVGVWRVTAGLAELDVVLVNLAWTAYNIAIITAGLAVAWERRQRRTFPRVRARVPAALWLADDRTATGRTRDLSLDGLALETDGRLDLAPGDRLHVALLDGEDTPLPAEVVGRRDRVLQLRFVRPMSIPEESALVRAIFSPPTVWLDWSEQRASDRPLGAAATIFGHALRGAFALPRGLLAAGRRGKGSGAAALLAGLAALALALAPPTAHAQPAEPPPTTQAPAPTASPSSPWKTRSLEDLGLTLGRKRYSTQTTLSLPLFARGDEVLTAARLTVRLDPDAPPPPGVTEIAIAVNGEPVGVIDISGAGSAATPDGDDAHVFDIDSRLLGERNDLSFAFALPEGSCATLVDVGSWLILAGGTLATRSAPLPLPSDLGVLPLPFFDPNADAEITIPVALLAPPSLRAVRVTSLVGAWFGLRAGERIRFPTTLSTLPPTSAVVVMTNAERALAPGVPTVDGPTVLLVDHPADPSGNHKLLVVTGRDEADLETAARRMVLDYEALTTGASVTLTEPPTPASRVPYDAPRWVALGRAVPLSDLAEPGDLTHEGALGGTITLRWRMPPDVFTWPSEHIDLDLAWSQDGPPGVPLPTLKVELNGRFIASLPVPGDGDARRRQGQRLRLPVASLAGYNELAVHVVPPGDGFCPDPEADRVVAALLGESTLGFEDAERFAVLPDIRRFIHDGFPYTRLADLSETAIVLPAAPTAEDVMAAVSFAAHAAAVTGYPPLGARFVGPTGVDGVADRDLVVIGDAARQPLVQRWADALPVAGLPGRPTPPPLPLLARVEAFLLGLDRAGERERLALALERPQAEAGLVIGLESPLRPGRSVVLLTATVPAAMPDFVDIRGFAEATVARTDVLVQSGGDRALFQIGDTYDVGALPLLAEARYFLARHWFLLVPALLLAALLGAWVGKRRLAQLEHRRLAQGGAGSRS